MRLMCRVSGTGARQTGPNPKYHDLTADGFIEGTLPYYQALSYSVLDPTNIRERERIAAEFNFNFDNGGLLQAIVSSATDDALSWTAIASVEGATTNVRGMFNPMLTANMGRPNGSDVEDLPGRSLALAGRFVAALDGWRLPFRVPL